MRAAQTLVQSLSEVSEVTTSGDLRRIVANSLLALARKEISATDLEAMAKGLDSVSNSLNSEIKVAKTAMEMRAAGAHISDIVRLGQLVIASDGHNQEHLK